MAGKSLLIGGLDIERYFGRGARFDLQLLIASGLPKESAFVRRKTYFLRGKAIQRLYGGFISFYDGMMSLNCVMQRPTLSKENTVFSYDDLCQS
jgi:hypothetical protein